MALKFYKSVATGLKLKVRKFWGLIPKFVEVIGENGEVGGEGQGGGGGGARGGGAFWSPHPK